MQGLLVRTGAGRGSAPGALTDDDDIIAAPLHFHGRTQTCRTGSNDDTAGSIDRHVDTGEPSHCRGTGFKRKPGHIDIGQRVENFLRDVYGHRHLSERDVDPALLPGGLHA